MYIIKFHPAREWCVEKRLCLISEGIKRTCRNLSRFSNPSGAARTVSSFQMNRSKKFGLSTRDIYKVSGLILENEIEISYLGNRKKKN